MDSSVLAVLVALFIGFVIFLVLRGLMCWYWKINRIVSLLEGIQASLNNANSNSPAVAADALPPLTPDKEICPFCKEPSSKSESICEICGMMKR